MQYGAVGKTFYFNFAINGINGDAKLLASVSWALRKCGRPRTDAAIMTGQSALHVLNHSDYNDGCCEIAIDSTTLTDGATYALYAWAEIDTDIIPSACVGQFELTSNGAIPGTATASPPGQTTGYATTYDEEGVVEPNVVVTCQLISVDQTITGIMFDSAVRSETSNGSGLVQFQNLFVGGTYEFKRRSSSSATANGYRITIPASYTEGTYPLPPIIGTP